jgi:hypothetical protein
MSVDIPIEVDPRLAWLARAAARHLLVENGVMTLDDAFDGLIECLSCTCTREMVERWEVIRSLHSRGRRPWR